MKLRRILDKMARFTPKRICRNAAIIFIIVVMYFWLSFDGENQIEYSDDLKAKTLLINDFWVPEKRFVKVYRGPGDGGRPVYSSASEEKRKQQQSYVEYGFNQFISDKISLNRTLPDTRPKQ
jgi:hypothetical protein